MLKGCSQCGRYADEKEMVKRLRSNKRGHYWLCVHCAVRQSGARFASKRNRDDQNRSR